MMDQKRGLVAYRGLATTAITEVYDVGRVQMVAHVRIVMNSANLAHSSASRNGGEYS